MGHESREANCVNSSELATDADLLALANQRIIKLEDEVKERCAEAESSAREARHLRECLKRIIGQ